MRSDQLVTVLSAAIFVFTEQTATSYCNIIVCNHFLFVYCKLQSTQSDRVLSKGELRKGREAGTIHGSLDSTTPQTQRPKTKKLILDVLY